MFYSLFGFAFDFFFYNYLFIWGGRREGEANHGRVWSEENLKELVLSVHHMGPRDQTQVTGLGSILLLSTELSS